MHNEITALKEELYYLRRTLSRNQLPTNDHVRSSNPPHELPSRSNEQLQQSEKMDIDQNNFETDQANSSPLHNLQSPTSSRLPQPPDHAKYMESCFRSRIGLDPLSRKDVHINSFHGVLIATGYNRVIITWQGYFVEMEKEDIIFDHLTRNAYPDDGEESWLSPGLKIFSLTRPDNRRRPLAHRFSIIPPHDLPHPCNPLSTEKWYLHAYQARFLVGNVSKSLNSRTMAFILSERYPDKYHPRGKDILLISNHQSNHQNQSRKPRNLPAPTVPSHSTNNQVPTSVPNSHSQLAPTPFVPMPLHNQPFLPAGVRIPSEYTRPAALWTQPWPTGVATQQRPLPPHLTPQPTANYPVQPNYFYPHQQPSPLESYPLTSPTYA